MEAPDSSKGWIELRGERVWIYVPEADEALGREILSRAERAAKTVSDRFEWTPSQPIRIVVNDSSDDPNGLALPFPYPQIQVYVSAPREGDYLASYDDWLDILVRHELTHIHHLDRNEGFASIPRYIFGNAPDLGSPGASVPIFLIEGLAVWEESHPDSGNRAKIGRTAESATRGLLRAAALNDSLPQPDEVSVLGVPYPGGLGPYLYGAAFWDFVDRTCPAGTLNEIVKRHSRKLVPFLIQQSVSDACGRPFYGLWDDWKAELRKEAQQAAASRAVPAAAPVFTLKGPVTSVRWLRDGLLVRSLDPDFGLQSALLSPDDGTKLDTGDFADRIPYKRRAVVEPPNPDGIWVFEQIAVPRPGTQYFELKRWQHGKSLPFEGGFRGFDAGVHPDGSRWAFVRNRPPVTELLVGDGVSPPEVIRAAESGVSWSSPRFSADGSRLIAARRRNGEVRLVMLDAKNGYAETAVFGFANTRNIDPRFMADGRVVFSSDLGGIYNLYVLDPATGAIQQLTDTIGGAFDPEISPDGLRVAYREQLGQGQGVGTAKIADTFAPKFAVESAQPMEPFVRPAEVAAGKKPYSPWPMYLPRFWIPLYAQAPNDFLLGAFTGGQDALRRGFWSTAAYWGLNSQTPRVFATVGGHRIGSIWGQPIPFVQFSRNLASFGRADIPRVSSTGAAVIETRDLWNDRIRASAGFTTSSALTVAQLPFLEDTRQGFTFMFAGFYERRRDLDGALTAYAASRGGLDPGTYKSLDLVGATAVAGYSWLRFAPTSLGPRMGLDVSVLGEGVLKEVGSDRTGANLSVDARIYLPVPNVARNTIALRAAAGTTFNPRIMVSTYTLGGAIGEGPAVLTSGRIPLLRGYPDSAFGGDKLLAFNSEYRINVLSIHRGLWLLPLHLDTLGLVGFFDAGQVWSRNFSSSNFLKGAGGETWIDGRLLYYLPMRLRVSVAKGFDNGGGTETRVILGSTF